MSFKRSAFLIFSLMLCLSMLSMQLIQAQESGEDKVTRLATKFDQYAASYGLLNGDGQISAVERAYATALISDAVGYSQLIAEFAAADRENARMLVLMEAGYLNVQQDLPIADPNEPALRQALEDYKESLPEEEYEKAEHALMALNDDLLAPLTAPITPPQTAASDAGDDDLLAPLTPPDTAEDDDLLAPLTPVEVDDDLLAPLTPPESTDDDGPLAPPPADNDDSDDSDILAPLTPRKTINRHVKKVIKDTFKRIPPERVKVTSGIYIYSETNRTVAGDCGGSAPGSGTSDVGSYPADHPAYQAHVCFSYQHGLISVDTEMFRWYGHGGLNMYQSDGVYSANTYSQEFLTVIDEYSFDVTRVSDYGTCTITTTSHYELYKPGEVIGCKPNANIWVVNGELIDVEDGNQPTEEEKDEEEVPVPPIVAGAYRVNWLPLDEKKCDQQYAPSFDSVTVTPTSFDSVELTVNGETYSFGGANMNEGLEGRFHIDEGALYVELHRRFAEDFNFLWHQSSPDYTSSCTGTATLTLDSPAAEQPKFTLADRVEAPADTVDPALAASAPFDAPPSGSYNVQAVLVATSDCQADRRPEFPQTTQASLEVSEGSIMLDLGTEQYTLVEGPTGYTFYNFKEDSSGLMVVISNVANNMVYVSYTIYGTDRKSCSMNLTLTQ